MSTMVRAQLQVGRQHGAMEYSAAPTDLDAVRRYRLERVRQQLRENDLAGILLYDQLNTRYVTDATNMQIWCSHNETRYVFVATDGPVILFEYGSCQHLAEDLPTVNEVRPTRPWFYFAAGPRSHEKAIEWSREIADLVREHGGGNRRLAIDRVGLMGIDLLRNEGVELVEGFPMMEHARCIKSDGEIALMRSAVATCEAGVHAMREALEPGITENALWAKLHEVNIAQGGEWIETRLLSSGPRTNPWFRESSLRAIQAGDLVSFDTDLIGPYGYCVDMSRSWVCGDSAPTSEQRRLHDLAREQIRFNTELLRVGTGFAEFSEKSWKIPSEFASNRYGSLAHGAGLCDEYPSIKHWSDWGSKGFDGVLEAGMVMCVESYIGSESGGEGVKLEEQYLLSDEGPTPLTTYPMDLQ